MRRNTGLVAMVSVLLTVCLLAPPAAASPEWSPSAYKLVVGIQGAGDPLVQMQTQDSVFMDVTAKRVDRKRKVIYKTTFGENVPESGIQSFRWIGRTTENACALRFSAYHWRKREYVTYFEPQIANVTTAGASVVVQNSENAEAFVSNDGVVRAKVSCASRDPFTLKTDRFYFYSGI